MGDTLASVQSAGSSPLSTVVWNMALNPGASCFAQVFRMTLEILSGPTDLAVLIFDNSFSMPGVVMFSDDSLVLDFLGNFSLIVPSLLVNTELNCSTIKI